MEEGIEFGELVGMGEDSTWDHRTAQENFTPLCHTHSLSTLVLTILSVLTNIVILTFILCVYLQLS